MKRHTTGLAPLAAGLALLASGPAIAQGVPIPERDEAWLISAQGTATRSAHEPSTEYFMPGGSAGLGVYHSLSPYIQLGGRLSGIVVPADEAPPQGIESSGDLALGAFSGMMRVRPLADPWEQSRAGGLYIEAGGGPALVGDELSGAVDVGLGWNFSVSDVVALGPNLRYMQAFESDDRFVGDDPRIWMAGLEIALLGEVDPPVQPPADDERIDVHVTVNMPETERSTAMAYVDRDADRVDDRFDHCPEDKETFNRVDDHDGCPDTGAITLGDTDSDTVVIDEAVFFPFDEATLTEEGRAALLDVAAAYHQAEEPWDALILRGHTDTRGDAAYNAELSQARVDAVRTALVKMGLPERSIFTEAYGENAPLSDGETAMAHHLNRRVEFVIDR